MSRSDVDHVSALLDRGHLRRPSSQSSNELFYDAPISHSINASLAHTPSPALLRSTTYSAGDFPDDTSDAAGRASPDPHDYYRHQPSVAPENDGSSKPRPPPFQRMASLPSYNSVESSSPRSNLGHQHRATSDSLHRGVGFDSTKPTPNPAATRSRQVSFKDLVNKFDATKDQVLPAPSRPQDRSTPASPPGSPTTATRPRIVTRWNSPKSSAPTSPVDPVPPAGTDRDITSGKTRVNVNTPPIPPRPLRFGKRLSVDTGASDPNPGTNRRGSEGSLPSPNPAALNKLNPSPGLSSPLTPTAWYLGKTPFLEAVDPSANNHRRTRSDFPKNTGFAAAPGSEQSSSKPIPAPLQQEQQQRPSQNSTSPENPHSKSRIPISSRRVNSVSSSDAPPASSTTFSSRSSAQVPLPPKGISRLPKPASPPQSPPGMSEDDGPEPVTTAHGRVRLNRPGRNPPMQAYIATPPPQKLAPPLRSSRPRQPVSSATSPTASSRSKVVDRVSTIQRQITRDRENRGSRRERRLPELGHVDFASRRKQIQQAFNRTVQENERKEEEAAEIKRKVQTEKNRNELQHPLPEQQQQRDTAVNQAPPPPAEDAATVIDETCDDEQQQQQNNQPILQSDIPHTLPQLHLETDIPAVLEPSGSNTAAHPVTMDSPTLGLPDVTGTHSDPKASHLPPMSAVTLGSTDTHVTALDPEPQSGLVPPSLDTSHRTLLSQVMQFRESSPSSSSSSCDDPDYSFSDNDDKESIPIMLRDASCEESVDGSETQDTQDGDHMPQNQDTACDEPPSNRWSMSSWSSSLRDQHFADARFDQGSGEDLSHIAPSVDDSEAATTQSCSVASSTPPSIVGHQFTVTPPQAGPETEPKSATTSNRNTIGFSPAPSLARLGGWDSKRVTQLYFEELARGRGASLSVPPARTSPEPRRTDTADSRADSLTDDPVVVPSFDEVPGPDQARQSASLVFRDDWEHASPSIADWMQVAADDESAPSSDGQDATTSSARDSAPTPRLDTSKQGLPGTDEPQGTFGLAINVESPQEMDSTDRPENMASPLTTPKETTTKRAPPTPPPQVPLNVSQPQPEQQKQPPQNAAQAAAFAPLGLVQSTGSSESSSLRRLEPVPSPQAQPVDSSATSLAPSQSEPTSIDIKRPSPSPEQRRLKKRRHVIKELVDTEYNFGRDMKVVEDIYKGTSSSCLDLSTDDVKILFGNSDQVVQFSMAFLDTLKKAAKSIYVMPKSQRWTSKRARNRHLSAINDEQAAGAGPEVSEYDKDQATFVGQAFVTHMTQMEKVYTDYLKNHDAANKQLQTLQRNPKVAIWLKECRDWASDLTTAWDLDSLLVKPVQRILKYPLLLTELLDSTPTEHPDHALLLNALAEVTNISVRINEMKKRADLVGQVVGRKRNQSDVRAGLQKAFGRRTEKLRQQVGLSDMFEDKEYDSLSQRFGESYFQLQVVMRDVESYTQEAQGAMGRFNEFILAIDGYIGVAQSNYPEMETRWRDLKNTVHDIVAVALPDHLDIVRKSVIDPMIKLLGLHDGPQRVMRKRDKRLMDYARFRAVKDRGDKPDKKTTEQGEQFTALNETLKDELPKLYSLTAKLMEACLKNFVQIQTTWFNSLQTRLSPLVDSFPDDLEKIFNEWASDFTFSDAQVLSLGICNGSLIADTISQFTPSTAAISSSRRPSTANSGSTRVGSNMEESPKASHEFSGSVSHKPGMESQSHISLGRSRAASAVSGPGPRGVPGESIEIPQQPQILQQQMTASPGPISGPVPAPPLAPPPAPPVNNATTTNSEPFPSLPQLSIDPFLTSSFVDPANNENHPATPGGRYSGFFSSAMPMSDNPEESNNNNGNAPAEPVKGEPPKEPKVLFLAASIYEFNIDRARREAGYPYLTYVAGEIFDVIAEKGELWLAKNQDDPTRQVGWIWNKHFAKLSG